MISLAFNTILELIWFSLVLGFLSGFIYSVIEIVSIYVADKSLIRESKNHVGRTGFFKQIFDFMFFFILGIIFVLLCYAFCDGVISLYSIIFLTSGVLIARKISWKIVKTEAMFGKRRKNK